MFPKIRLLPRAFTLVVVIGSAVPAYAQLGMLTSVIGEGRIAASDGNEVEWVVGSSVAEGDTIVTQPDSYAMLFFVSGLGTADIEFDGTIVVEVDQNTTLEVRRGRGFRRAAPIDIHVVQGRVRAFFDAGEHKDYILLSTPLGQLQVTGSVIYAAHNAGDNPGSELGSFDSDCVVRLPDGGQRLISRNQKVVIREGQEIQTVGLRSADQQYWEQFPDLNLTAALASRSDVRGTYASRTWVGGYVIGGRRLEDVAAQGSTNIPSQEPEVASTAPATPQRLVQTAPRQGPPRLRAATSGRTTGDDEGVERETLTVGNTVIMRRAPGSRLRGIDGRTSSGRRALQSGVSRVSRRINR